jgi:hypothetical protein
LLDWRVATKYLTCRPSVPSCDLEAFHKTVLTATNKAGCSLIPGRSRVSSGASEQLRIAPEQLRNASAQLRNESAQLRNEPEQVQIAPEPVRNESAHLYKPPAHLQKSSEQLRKLFAHLQKWFSFIRNGRVLYSAGDESTVCRAFFTMSPSFSLISPSPCIRSRRARWRPVRWCRRRFLRACGLP